MIYSHSVIGDSIRSYSDKLMTSFSRNWGLG